MMPYPTSLRKPLIDRIKQVRKRGWRCKPERVPNAKTFQLLVDLAFQASLLTEEQRRPGFRLLYCSPEDLRSDEVPAPLQNRSRVISMPSPRPLTASELNRIAPAADLTRLLVCVHPENKSNSLCIWGLLDVGDNWWKFVHHEASSGRIPPNFLTIASTAPGELSFSMQGAILLVWKNGVLYNPSSNPIWSGPMSDYFEPSRKYLYDEVLRELKTDKFDKDRSDDEYPLRFYNFFLERILYSIRHLGHGGTVIVVPREIGVDDPRLTDRISLKYATNYDYAWDSLVRSLVKYRYYFDLHFRLTKEKDTLSTADFHRHTMLEHERTNAEEDNQDIAKSIASLTSVDGVVVMTTRFEVLGFGGEIVAASPTLRSVTVASDDRRPIPIESFGTRHRSAFRFCSSFEDSAAFIISSDGGVKAAKRHGRELLFWPDINQGAFGL